MTSVPSRCPIPGCNFHFNRGIVGWTRHIGAHENHPQFHGTVFSPEDRRALFVTEYPRFFDNTQSRYSSTPPTTTPTRISNVPNAAPARVEERVFVEVSPQPPSREQSAPKAESGVASAIPPILALFIREAIKEGIKEAIQEMFLAQRAPVSYPTQPTDKKSE